MSVCRAAKMSGVPESTLWDRTLGLQPVPDATTGYVTNPGPSPTFSKIEENQLFNHVSYMVKIGYGYSRKEFTHLATDFAICLNKKVMLSHHLEILGLTDTKPDILSSPYQAPEAVCGQGQSNLSCCITGILHSAWFLVKRKWSAWKTWMYLEHRWNWPSDGTQSFKGSLPERFTASGNNPIKGQNNHYHNWWQCSRRQNTPLLHLPWEEVVWRPAARRHTWLQNWVGLTPRYSSTTFSTTS